MLQLKNNQHKAMFIIAAVYGMTALVLAAMGSHVFNIDRSSADYILFNNAITYQLLHAILVLWLTTLEDKNFWINSAIYSMVFGVLLFCGGLYILVIQGKTSLSWITPVGGSFFNIGLA